MSSIPVGTALCGSSRYLGKMAAFLLRFADHCLCAGITLRFPVFRRFAEQSENQKSDDCESL